MDGIYLSHYECVIVVRHKFMVAFIGYTSQTLAGDD